MLDRSDSTRFAAKIFLLKSGEAPNAKQIIIDLAMRANLNPNIIAEVWRKPLATRHNTDIPYEGKTK
jgi:hypothetical protein